MLSPEIMEFYRRGGERDRLREGEGLLEYLRTMDVLTRTLPPAPAEVLDVGGATGVYAAPLAEAGYRVRLIDPVPEQVAEAAGRHGVIAEVGDARALPVPDASADAVLLLGPLYHLLERADRVRAWREAARVVRPGGVVVAATISRFSSLCAGYVHDLHGDARFRALVDGALADGAHRNTEAIDPYLVTAYFHHPDEIAGEAAEAGLTVRHRLAVEGPLWLTGPRLTEVLAAPESTARYLDWMRRIEADPTLLGASAHLLTVATP